MRRQRTNRRILCVEALEGRLLLSGNTLPVASLQFDCSPDRSAWTDGLDRPGDIDVFAIAVDDGQLGPLRVWAEPDQGSHLDSFLSLYGPDGQLLTQSDDAAADEFGGADGPRDPSAALIEQHLLAGTYRLEVSASRFADEAAGVGGYTLGVDWQPAGEPFDSIKVEGQPWAIAAGDFNGDGNLDLVTAGTLSNDVSILLGLGDGAFQKQETTYKVGEAPNRVVVADFDGDRNPDLAVANATSHDVSVLLGRGDGTFVAKGSSDVSAEPRGLAAGDFNEDGYPDLVAANQGAHTISILVGSGDGTFDESRYSEYDTQPEAAPRPSPRSVAVG